MFLGSGEGHNKMAETHYPFLKLNTSTSRTAAREFFFNLHHNRIHNTRYKENQKIKNKIYN